MTTPLARRQTGNVLALPSEFRETALGFPNRIKAILAKIETPAQAADGLAKAQAIADYAKQIKATQEEVNSIQYGKLLLAAKVGEFYPSEKGGRGQKNPTGSASGFHKSTLAQYRKLARHQSEGRVDHYWEAVVDADHEAEMSIAGFLNYVGSGGVIATRHGGGVIEWYTPKKYIVKVRKVLGMIELDPATSEVAQRVVKAKIHYTKEDDGLARDWQGKVFLNPPFKMPLVEKFVNKLCDEYEAGRVTEAILLTNNNTDTDWWQRAGGMASSICFTDGRIGFYNEAGETSAPTNGQSFIYLGDRTEEFVRQFLMDVGECFSPTPNGEPVS